jgi:hypothetical protein
MAATADPWLLAADLLDPPPEPTSGDLAECKADVTVFIERHASIEDPDGTVVPFTLWPFQHEPLQALQAGDSIIVLKARRLGLSWVVLAFALWRAIFQQGIRILILCKNEDDATELLDRIRRMKQRISENPDSAHILAGLRQPPKLRDAVKTLDVGSSTIRALVGTPAAARSETAGLVIADEFAFQRDDARIWPGLLPTIEGGGQAAIISTGNGPANVNKFAEQWSKANSGDTDLTAMFFPWMARPDRTPAWRDAQIAKLGPDEFGVEYPETPDDALASVHARYVFSSAAIDAAVELGRRLDQERLDGTLPAPIDNRMAAGVDWGDFRSHAVPIWELERGGIYVPPGEVSTTQQDVEDITMRILDSLGQYDHWFGEERYDASFKQSNRTFARTAEAVLGPHNPMRRIGRPNTVPVAFGTYKSLTVAYLRFLLRRTLAGETTRVLAISPANTIVIEQMRTLEQKEDGMIIKGNDDAVDSLIAGTQPVAKRHRALVEDIG